MSPTVPFKPETGMVEGYGFAAPEAGIVIGVALQNCWARLVSAARKNRIAKLKIERAIRVALLKFRTPEVKAVNLTNVFVLVVKVFS